jgi:mRNA-degrading endonuclease toxin of MazEF toxin-antitoxin module
VARGVEASVPRRGSLYWALVEKRRPVLVLSVDARNERANDFLAVPCSTTLREAPTHVRLLRGEGGVPQTCMLKCEQITTVGKHDIDSVPLGPPLSPARLREIERAVARAIGVVA